MFLKRLWNTLFWAPVAPDPNKRKSAKPSPPKLPYEFHLQIKDPDNLQAYLKGRGFRFDGFTNWSRLIVTFSDGTQWGGTPFKTQYGIITDISHGHLDIATVTFPGNGYVVFKFRTKTFDHNQENQQVNESWGRLIQGLRKYQFIHKLPYKE